jgi:hypothetical protein
MQNGIKTPMLGPEISRDTANAAKPVKELKIEKIVEA